MKLKVAGLMLLSAVFGMSAMRPVVPQNPATTPFQVTITSTQGPHTQCNVSPAGGFAECHAADGLWLSLNGGAYAQVCTVGMTGCGGTATAAVLSVNGVKPGTTGNIDISLSAPLVTTSVSAPVVSAPSASGVIGAPPLSLQNGQLAVGAPSVTVTVAAPTVTAPTATSTATPPVVTATGS